MNNRTIWAKISKIRDDERLQLQELGDILGMNSANLSRYVRGVQDVAITLEAVYRLCKYYNVNIDDFISAPVENFAISKLKQKTKLEKDKNNDTVYQSIIDYISSAYKDMDTEQRVWFKVSLVKYIDSITK